MNNFLQCITPKKLSYILYFIIFFHVLLTAYLLHANQLARQVDTRNKIFQKITNAVYLLEATPVPNRQEALNVIDDPDIQVDLSGAPKSPLQFRKDSFWKIMHALEQSQHTFSISVQLENKQWVNIQGALYTHIVLTQLFFMLIELLIFSAIILAFWSINRFSAPLKKIKLSAESLGIDLSFKPIDVYGPKQVREVSKALNQMQNRISQLVRHRTQLLASISHDLRTPIMRAQLRAQFIEDSDYKTQLLVDLDEMEKMIAETLSFARAEGKSEAQTHIDLVSLLSSICDDAVDMRHDVTLFTNEHRVAITGRCIALKRAFTNVINNAIRYAGSAVVRIVKRRKFIFIIIEDNGPGILETDLEKVFEPFYRGEHSRSHHTGGVGLGLSVVRDIILSHQGKIKLKNKKSGGLKVVIELLIDSQ